MPVTIQIPTALRAFTDKLSEIPAEGSTVGEAVKNFADTYPDIRTHLYDERGELRAFINIYIGDENIRNRDGLDTPVRDGDILTLVPAIAGGLGGL
jgi:molybdopterin converting factor small subunit